MDTAKEKEKERVEAAEKVLFSGGVPDLRDESGKLAFEQYKLYLEITDRLSERRQNANVFYLTLNTGLIAVLGFLFSKETNEAFHAFAWVVPIGGILSSLFWKRTVLSYRQLNKGKFQIIHLVEARLPLRLFEAEWIALDSGNNPAIYHPLTAHEEWIPVFFLAIHAALSICLFAWAYCL